MLNQATAQELHYRYRFQQPLHAVSMLCSAQDGNSLLPEPYAPLRLSKAHLLLLQGILREDTGD